MSEGLVAPTQPPRRPPPLAEATAGLIRRTGWKRTAATGLLCIAALGLLGFIKSLDAFSFLRNIFGLNAELNVPAFFSGALLWVASITCWTTSALASPPYPARAAVLGLAALFAWMGVDEVVQVHERLEGATGVDWQVLYAPLGALGAVALILTVRHMPGVPERAVLVLGASAWLVAQVFEDLQWNGDQQARYFHVLMGAEELLEMTGSLLFGLAFMLVLAGTRPPDAAASSLSCGDQPGQAKRSRPTSGHR